MNRFLTLGVVTTTISACFGIGYTPLRTMEDLTRDDLRETARLFVQFEKEHGRLPASMDELCEDHSLCEDHAVRRDWYLTPLRYRVVDGGFELRSAGPDEKFETRDDLVLNTVDEEQAVRRMAGCYRIGAHWWDRFTDEIVILDTLYTNNFRYELRPPLVKVGGSAAWTTIGTDSVELMWLAHHQYSVRVRAIAGDSLSGSVSGDAQYDFVGGPRVPCPS